MSNDFVDNNIFINKISKIKLKNFRVYDELELSLNGKIIFFIGNNGIGKTSILEAIHLTAILKSFRNAKDKDIIKWNSSFFNVDIEFINQTGLQSIHLGYGKIEPNNNNNILSNTKSNANKKSLIFNKKKYNKVSEFIGKFHTVVFSADDILIVDTTPDARRKYIDMVISSINNEYFVSLQQYRKTLFNKSQLLRNYKYKKMSIDDIFFKTINKKLAKLGHYIQIKRKEFLEEFQEYFQKYVSLISREQDQWDFTYQPSIQSGYTEEKFYEELNTSTNIDLRTGQNTKGIHRDNILFTHNKKELKQIASQGQKRTAVLSLKMAQYEYTKEKLNESPILLIDDVLNELDVQRRGLFIEFLNHIGQALITTTDIHGMDDFINKNKSKFNIEIFEITREKEKYFFNKINI